MAVWHRFGEEASIISNWFKSYLLLLIKLNDVECDRPQIDRHRILDTMPSGKVGDRGSSATGRGISGQDSPDESLWCFWSCKLNWWTSWTSLWECDLHSALIMKIICPDGALCPSSKTVCWLLGCYTRMHQDFRTRTFAPTDFILHMEEHRKGGCLSDVAFCIDRWHWKEPRM